MSECLERRKTRTSGCGGIGAASGWSPARSDGSTGPNRPASRAELEDRIQGYRPEAAAAVAVRTPGGCRGGFGRNRPTGVTTDPERRHPADLAVGDSGSGLLPKPSTFQSQRSDHLTLDRLGIKGSGWVNDKRSCAPVLVQPRSPTAEDHGEPALRCVAVNAEWPFGRIWFRITWIPGAATTGGQADESCRKLGRA